MVATRLHSFCSTSRYRAVAHSLGAVLAVCCTLATASAKDATNELISLHVSEATRRAAPMPPEILAWLAQLQEAHHTLGRPAEVGRVMGLGAGPTTPSSAR